MLILKVGNVLTLMNRTVKLEKNNITIKKSILKSNKFRTIYRLKQAMILKVGNMLTSIIKM